MKRAGIWLTWSGVALIVLGIGAAIALGATSVSSLTGNEDPIPVSGPGNSLEAYFEEGEHMQLWVSEINGFAGAPEPECEITGPAEIQPGTQAQSSVTVMGRTRESFASFRIVESGVYTVVCDQDGVTVAPPLSVQGIFAGALAVIAAVGGGTFGLVLAVPGVILWVLGNRPAQAPPPA